MRFDIRYAAGLNFRYPVSRTDDFSLPFYADSGVIEYPSIFGRWVRALSSLN